MRRHPAIAIAVAAALAMGATTVYAEETMGGDAQDTAAEFDEVSRLERLLGPERALALLEERARYLDEETAALDRKAMALNELERMIKARLDELQEAEKRVSDLIEKERELERVHMEQLLKIYKSLKPRELRKVLWELDYDTRVQILKRLQPKKVAKIIALLDPKEAARVSESLLKVGGQR